MNANHLCERCVTTFTKELYYQNHIKRKYPCKEIKKPGKEIKKPMEETSPSITIKNQEGIQFLSTIDNNSIDLVLTDPPYITSSDTGMGNLHKQIEQNKQEGIEFVSTEEEWDSVKDKYIGKKDMSEDKMKDNFMRFGSIYGSKYSVQTDYGEWDSTFTMEQLDTFIGEYYRKLRQGGTLIIFFDIWKITPLKELMEKHKFKQIRFIEWIKTNPQPLNSGINYLTNCREIALLGVKGSKPTFNSKYDNAIYRFPIQGGKNRFHPTQKSLALFEALIEKHSNEGDLVIDTFLGSGTTAVACQNKNRNFKGCEVSKEYYDKMMEILDIEESEEEESEEEESEEEESSGEEESGEEESGEEESEVDIEIKPAQKDC